MESYVTQLTRINCLGRCMAEWMSFEQTCTSKVFTAQLASKFLMFVPYMCIKWNDFCEFSVARLTIDCSIFFCVHCLKMWNEVLLRFWYLSTVRTNDWMNIFVFFVYMTLQLISEQEPFWTQITLDAVCSEMSVKMLQQIDVIVEFWETIRTFVNHNLIVHLLKEDKNTISSSL